ncbi:MAG: hypothetical protein EZS28_052469, partial [Streblomastix strix]
MCQIFEFYTRGNLHNVIADLKIQPQSVRVIRVWAILAQIIRSLDYFHSKGISHQNIKPDNIFLMENGSIRLGDFGHSKVLLDRDDSAETGTKVYIAAEVWQNKKPDFASDIFSVGIIVFQMLIGHHPFEDGSELSTIENIKQGKHIQIP